MYKEKQGAKNRKERHGPSIIHIDVDKLKID